VAVFQFFSLWIASKSSRGGFEAKISRFRPIQRELLALGEIAFQHCVSAEIGFHCGFRGSKFGVQVPGSRFRNFPRFRLYCIFWNLRPLFVRWKAHHLRGTSNDIPVPKFSNNSSSGQEGPNRINM
jgi:hypothetical protein